MWKKPCFPCVAVLVVFIGACNVLQDDGSHQEASVSGAGRGTLRNESVHEAATGIASRAEGPGGLTVMTRNLYIGADVDVVLSARSPEEVPVLAGQAFQTLLSTDFSERARALASEIARAEPHVVGIQEATTIRVQSPGDAVFGGASPATAILLDYLAILVQALQREGLDYRVVGAVQNTDVEIPVLASIDPIRFDDVRVTDFDVILARYDVDISRVVETSFSEGLTIAALGTVIQRGYVAVDATVSGRTYRVVNTHLEPFSQSVQTAQIRELLDALEAETLPTVLLGDLNTLAPFGETYRFLASEGFVDLWSLTPKARNAGGFTCCQHADLRNTTSVLDRRIDLILFRSPGAPGARGGLGAVVAEVVGNEPQDRTESGLWPSDHAGVVATMRIPASVVHARAENRMLEQK